MGSPKASLLWHGSTLLRRVTGIIARCVDGPVLVVAARGQQLPELAPEVEIVEDEQEYRGPLQGLAGGLAAVRDRAEIAYASSTDVPLLHPTYVRLVLAAVDDRVDVVLPEVGGYRQPLAAAYRTSLLVTVRELIAAGQMKPAFLFERCRVRRIGGDQLLRDPELARHDPGLDSVANLNERADYERAHARPAPEIDVQRFGTLALRGGPRRQALNAWTLGELAAAAGLTLDAHIVAGLNGDQISRDEQLPLVAGDVVSFMTADAGG
jgi:molybdopterin-guanine dinucleotide biosynthesis protein A